MYLYLNFGLSLRDPFDRSPCTREISVAMSQCIIAFEEMHLMCLSCDSSFRDHVMGEVVNNLNGEVMLV